MNNQDFAKAFRQWELKSNQWFVRHSFILFFPILLACFVVFFIITINLINVSSDMHQNSSTEKLLLAQNISTLFLAFLILLNSFWTIYMLASIFRIRSILKNVDFNLSRRQNDRKAEDPF